MYADIKRPNVINTKADCEAFYTINSGYFNDLRFNIKQYEIGFTIIIVFFWKFKQLKPSHTKVRSSFVARRSTCIIVVKLVKNYNALSDSDFQIKWQTSSWHKSCWCLHYSRLLPGAIKSPRRCLWLQTIKNVFDWE